MRLPLNISVQQVERNILSSMGGLLLPITLLFLGEEVFQQGQAQGVLPTQLLFSLLIVTATCLLVNPQLYLMTNKR